MKNAVTETNILVHFASFYGNRVMPDGSSYLTDEYRKAANRLVKRGLFERVNGPMGAGYRITEVGKVQAENFLSAFIEVATGNSGVIKSISE